MGVFVPEDTLGLQLTEVCRQMGIRVPEDLAIVGVDNDDVMCELAQPPLSSIAVPSEKVGYEAAAMLEHILSGKKQLRERVVLPPLGVVARQSSDVLGVSDGDVAAAVRFIRERASVPISVKEVVEQVAVGRRTLERRFQRVLGHGIWKEIRQAHLTRARLLLADTDLSITEVARQSGFTDLRQLCNTFRQETGLTPTEYRRRVRAG